MDKLRFEFTVKSSIDGKSNVMAITAIGTPDNRIFGKSTKREGYGSL